MKMRWGLLLFVVPTWGYAQTAFSTISTLSPTVLTPVVTLTATPALSEPPMPNLNVSPQTSPTLPVPTTLPSAKGKFFLQVGGGTSNSNDATGFNVGLGAGVQVTDSFSVITELELNSVATAPNDYLYFYYFPTSFQDWSLSENLKYSFLPHNIVSPYLLLGAGMDYIDGQNIYGVTDTTYFGFQAGIGAEARLGKDLWLYAEGRLHEAAAVDTDAGPYSYALFQAGLREAFGQGSAVPTSTPGPSTPGINPYLQGNRFFVEPVGEVGFLLGGDLANAVNAFNNQYPNYPYYVNGEGGGENYNASNETVAQYGFELGYALDPYNGISLGYSDGQGASLRMEYETFSNGGMEVDQDLSLRLQQFSLNYYRYLPDGDGRWYATLGGSYFAASASYSYDLTSTSQDVSDESTSPLTGGGWGASLGLGRQWVFLEDIGLDLSARFMTGNIPSLQGGYVSSVNGYSTFGTGALAIYPGSNTMTLLDVNSFAGSGARRLTVDMTGFNFSLGVVLYY